MQLVFSQDFIGLRSFWRRSSRHSLLELCDSEDSSICTGKSVNPLEKGYQTLSGYPSTLQDR